MPPKENKSASSPSRTYVAICTMDFKNHYCKKFTLPDLKENTTDFARYYFLNNLDFTACLAFILTYEDYSNIRDVKD